MRLLRERRELREQLHVHTQNQFTPTVDGTTGRETTDTVYPSETQHATPDYDQNDVHFEEIAQTIEQQLKKLTRQCAVHRRVLARAMTEHR
eukprot:1313101-Pyramimonas_sp.AAC.1